MNSIFRKWAVASIAITFCIILILILSITWLVQRDFYKQGLDQLKSHAQSAEQSFEEYEQGNLSLAEFRTGLKRIEKDNDVNISIIGKKVNFLKKELLDIGVRPDVRSWVTSVNEGNSVEKISTFRKQDNEKMLVVGFPLRVGDKVVASGFIYSPVADVKLLSGPIRKKIWLVALACVGPLMLLLWVAARRFVKPIQEMNAAASSVAAGDFSRRVKVKGDDEVAQLGSAFNIMAERMERIEDQRRQLIMEITHELRTPLTTIRATLQAVSDGILTASELNEFITLSLEESKRLGSLIDNLHELSAFEEHQVKFDFNRVDLTELVEQTVVQFQPKAEQLGIYLNMHMDQNRPIYINGDSLRIKQVLINLIGNSLDHNKSGIRVNVSLQSHSYKARIIVQDNGQGIAAEHMAHLFERLYKVESSRSTRGSGLGLTISRHIVNAHGGTIIAKSEVGKGTEFEVELPLVLA
ncbi:sensor histidine kinase [Paenibacillus psychroresistens]|uniref:histidine kinase n=1 Tax=Paenibacillus psychroresistens TaxID=1778678 RepID=A0A6B8RUU2_9BACL|nr:ATP-binding protein [Paenibacillus psychroresistens]QGQ99707.1 sensor histidine kinase [Paenibacillus psychroresistens]